MSDWKSGSGPVSPIRMAQQAFEKQNIDGGDSRTLSMRAHVN
jgi:hypothetical protein